MQRHAFLRPGRRAARLVERCVDPVRRLSVLVLGETGARDESEALCRRWEDVDLYRGGFVPFASGRNSHRTKRGKDRWTPLTPTLAAALREHAAAHRLACNSPWVFHHDRTRRHYHAGDRIRSLRDGVMTAARRAELPPGWHLHDLRHRRVTAWLAAGKNPVRVKEAVGHSDLRTTMGYTHLAREQLRSLVEAPPTAAPAKAGIA